MRQTRDTELLLEIRSLREEIRELRVELHRALPKPPESNAQLLATLYTGTGGRNFLISDLLMGADQPGADSDPILVALNETTGLNRRSFSKFLSDNEGRQIGNFVIRRGQSKKSRDGQEWRIVSKM